MSTASRTVSGIGTSPSPRELEPTPPGLHRTADAQRGGQLLDEEGDPLGAVVDRAGQRGSGIRAERLCDEVGRLLEVERAQRELVELTGAAQVVAHAPDPVVAREPVGAVGRDHEHRHLPERLGERGQQLERRRVRPLQVVEDDQRVPLRGDVGEDAANRLEQRRTIGGRGGFPELRQQQRQLGAQRAAVLEPRRVRAQVAAQCGDDGAVRRGAALAWRTTQQDGVRSGRDIRREPALAHARLAAQEHDRALPEGRALQRVLEPGQLRVPADEPGTRGHARSLITACGRWKYGNPADDSAAQHA